MKKLKRWKKAARKQGWAVEGGGGRHLKWLHPDGETMVVTSATPSDHRALMNARSDLRRAGLDIS